MKVLRSTRWAGPAQAWVATFVTCTFADALLGRWVLLPTFVVGFYGGMLIMASLIYPALGRWQSWMCSRSVRSWYLTVVGLWTSLALSLALLTLRWLDWGWDETLILRMVGTLTLVASIVGGAWAMEKLGWPKLVLASALFPSNAGGEKSSLPQRLVIEGPYRYVRNPIYEFDIGVVFGTALLTGRWAVAILGVVYVVQLTMHVRIEERELRARYGVPYTRYCYLVPRFIPPLKPIDATEVHGELEQTLMEGCVQGGGANRNLAPSQHV